MEKIQTLLLIVLGLAIFVWRMVRKAMETTARESRERPKRATNVPSLPATSFEELLKQMQAQNQKANPSSIPAPANSTPAGRPLPREKAPEPRSLERTEVRPVSLEAAREARSLEAPSAEPRRAAALPRAAVAHADEDYWSRRPARQQEQARLDSRRNVADLLRSPADLRAAFVLAEILQRKY